MTTDAWRWPNGGMTDEEVVKCAEDDNYGGVKNVGSVSAGSLPISAEVLSSSYPAPLLSEVASRPLSVSPRPTCNP